MKKLLTIALMAIFAISAHAQNHWTNNPHLYANTMTVVGVVHINDAEIPRESMEVGAFCGDECRGSETLRYKPNADRYLVYLSVSGANGDVIRFRLYDAETEVELMATASTVTFEANAMLGRAGDPYVLDFTTTVDEVPIVAETNEVGATGAGGSVEGSGSYLYGEECTLTAVPDAGCFFENWTEETEDRATVVVSTDPVYTFVVTGRRNLTANFNSVSPEVGMANQFVKLYPGWNWFTSYLNFDNSLETVLKNAIAAKNYTALIKDMAQNTTLEDGVWSMSNLSIGNESMYMILVEDTVSLVLTSPLADPAAHPITLYPGWNWIGFISPRPVAVDDALSSITPTEGDVLKSSAFNTTYSAQNGWNGSLDSLRPGAGYMYLNSGTTSQTLTYPGLFSPTIEGHVEIPEGMDASNIIVTNFSEEVVPNEDGEFEIGDATMLMAKNAENGEIVYLSLRSIEPRTRGGIIRGDDSNLNAKETAILLALRLLPFNFSDGDDEVLEAMKTVVYSLPSVQALEAAIQATVATYGYLKEEAIEAAVDEVSDFIYEQLSSVVTDIVINGFVPQAPGGIASPQFYPTNRKHGIKLFIKDSESQYLSNPDRWSIKCTGYSSLFCPVRIVEGYYDYMYDHFTESPTGHSYTMPPLSLSQYVKLAEKTAIITNPVWPNFLELYRQMKQAMTDENYYLELTNVTLENMSFELPRSSNAIGILTPIDDEKVRVSSILYAVLDFLSVIPGVPPIPAETIVNAYLLDAEFMNYCHSQTNNTEGLLNIVNAINDKLSDVYHEVIGVDLALDFVNAYFFVGNVCGFFDYAFNMGNQLHSFSLPVEAEYYGVSLPEVQTSVVEVTPTSVTLAGSVEGGASAAVVERGFVYGDMSNSMSTIVAVDSGTGEFETTIEGLASGRRFYVLAYAKLANGELVYGNEETFLTYDGSLYVLTLSPSVGNNSSTAGFIGAIAGTSGLLPPTIAQFGFTYGRGHELGTVVAGVGQGELGAPFMAFVEDLEPNATYYLRAYAVIMLQGNTIILYGDEVSFFTGNQPTVTTHEVDQVNIGATSAMVEGSVVFPDATQPTEYERGFVISTTSDPLTLIIYGENDHRVYEGTDLLHFGYVFYDLWPNTPYYVRAYSYSPSGAVVYGDIESFTTLSDGSGDLPEGALGGTFTINADGDQVYFSQGNLQYQASTNTWRFAENQWDYVGTQNPYLGNPGGAVDGSDNVNISSTYSGWIDLFGWGTSGYNHGAVCYQPWSSSYNYRDYYVYGESAYNLFDQTGRADWGYNAIQNGGNSENLGWRSLTYEEFLYLIRTRNTTSGIRYAKAVVNDVNGLILLPDNWCSDYYALNNVNTSDADYLSNTISASQWLILEEHGAVFLPAAGFRSKLGIYRPGVVGRYWSASHWNEFHACFLEFNLLTDESVVNVYCYERCYGNSVRLVYSCESIEEYSIQVTEDLPEGGTVTGAGCYRNGVTCTLTAAASVNYAFVGWEENGQVVSTEDVYFFRVTGPRNLIAHFSSQGNGNGHDCVDLGLPSGNMWATCNVGANTPEEYGDHFAWGETQPKDYYDWSTYLYCNNGSQQQLTKYCVDPAYGYDGFSDDLTTLLPEDDAAMVNWGMSWRMPTKDEWVELYQNTTLTTITQNGVKGILLTARNGNSIFLPLSGLCSYDELNYLNQNGYYWSSSLHSPTDGSSVYLSNNYGDFQYHFTRRSGLSVRPVRSANEN